MMAHLFWQYSRNIKINFTNNRQTMWRSCWIGKSLLSSLLHLFHQFSYFSIQNLLKGVFQSFKLTYMHVLPKRKKQRRKGQSYLPTDKRTCKQYMVYILFNISRESRKNFYPHWDLNRGSRPQSKSDDWDRWAIGPAMNYLTRLRLLWEQIKNRLFMYFAPPEIAKCTCAFSACTSILQKKLGSCGLYIKAFFAQNIFMSLLYKSIGKFWHCIFRTYLFG